jgi:hypothetical protein
MNVQPLQPLESQSLYPILPSLESYERRLDYLMVQVEQLTMGMLCKRGVQKSAIYVLHVASSA